MTMFNVFKPIVWVLLAVSLLAYAIVLWLIDHGGPPDAAAKAVLARHLPDVFHHKESSDRRGYLVHRTLLSEGPTCTRAAAMDTADAHTARSPRHRITCAHTHEPCSAVVQICATCTPKWSPSQPLSLAPRRASGFWSSSPSARSSSTPHVRCRHERNNPVTT
jgi:hypothetical protein